MAKRRDGIRASGFRLVAFRFDQALNLGHVPMLFPDGWVGAYFSKFFVMEHRQLPPTQMEGCQHHGSFLVSLLQGSTRPKVL